MWESKFHVKVSNKVGLRMKEFTILNALDRISAIALYLPAMLTGIKEYSCWTLCWMYRSCRRHAAAMEVYVLILHAHETSEVLSQNLSICFY